MTKKDDNWFDARMLKIAIGLVTLFLGLVISLIVWGMNINVKQAVQDERIQVIQTSIIEIKEGQKLILKKVEEIDKKIPDNRISLLGDN